MLKQALVVLVVRLVFLLSLFAALLGSPAIAHAQLPKPVPAPPPATATKPAVEEEAADSPRASVRSFFDLAEQRRYQEASRYLDLPKGSEKRAAELASKLNVVLHQRLLIVVDQLSPLAQGRPTDGLPPGTEEIGKVMDAKNNPVPIRLVRHEAKSFEDEARWVFSQSTVSKVDALYDALADHWVRDKLPAPLLLQGPLTLAYWQWLAIPLLAILALIVGRVLTSLSGAIARRLLPKIEWTELWLPSLKRPVTLGWAVAVFAIAIQFLALTLKAEERIESVLRALGWLALFWALLRSIRIFGQVARHATWATERPTARSLSAVGVSLGRVVVAALALMVALSELGYPVTSVIAGLGIGGVALALAAQKTVENLFGSLSILADEPFRVGDTIRVDTIEGTVETIGLRSTRVRTVDRTLIIFPNGKLADMRIESLGPRERIRFATKLQLARATTTSQVKAIIAAAKERLRAHESVRKEEVVVHLASIGEASYDLEVSAPIETLDAAAYARIREELLIELIDIVEKAGGKLAVPTRQLLT